MNEKLFMILFQLTVFIPVTAVLVWFLICLVLFVTASKADEELKKKRKDQFLTSAVVVGILFFIAAVIFLVYHSISNQNAAVMIE